MSGDQRGQKNRSSHSVKLGEAQGSPGQVFLNVLQLFSSFVASIFAVYSP